MAAIDFPTTENRTHCRPGAAENLRAFLTMGKRKLFVSAILGLGLAAAAHAADPTSMEGFLDYGTTQLGLLKTFGIAVGVVAIGWTTFRLVKSWLGRAK